MIKRRDALKRKFEEIEDEMKNPYELHVDDLIELDAKKGSFLMGAFLGDDRLLEMSTCERNLLNAILLTSIKQKHSYIKEWVANTKHDAVCDGTPLKSAFEMSARHVVDYLKNLKINSDDILREVENLVEVHSSVEKENLCLQIHRKFESHFLSGIVTAYSIYDLLYREVRRKFEGKEKSPIVMTQYIIELEAIRDALEKMRLIFIK